MSLPKLLTTATLVLLATTNLARADSPQARYGVSPDRYMVEFGAAGGETHSLMVKNLSPEPLEVALSVGTWDLDEDNRIREIPPSETSLDQWIVINPLTATIPPDSPQTFRWAILPRQAPEPGEYRAIIFVEEVLSGTQQQAGKAHVRMKLRYGIPIYAQYGKAHDRGVVSSVSAEPRSASIVMALGNEGNRHARLQGRYGVWPTADFPGRDAALAQLKTNKRDQSGVHALDETVLLPGTRRDVTITPALPGPGAYTVQFSAQFGGTAVTDTVQLESAD